MPTIADKIALLPDNLQAEVADFVDFLIRKHHLDTETADLTEEQKQTLQTRYEKLNQNPESGMDWETAK
ncbi:MAG: DUF2281 domain-containing protein, partial [Cytophagales bacterium]|nr:DUF2281 domain-containing protein [Cytophagales bacterium]